MKRLLEDFTQKDQELFNTSFLNYLPDDIIDFHVHLWKKDFLNLKISEERQRSNPFTDDDIIDGFTIEEFKIVAEKLFPGKKYGGVFFALPLKEVDLVKSNQYISDICLESKSYGLYVPAHDMKYVPDDFFEKRFIGFKPYPDLAGCVKNNDFTKIDIDVSIYDFISKAVFDFSNKYGLILLIHIPRKGRLNDKRNIDEIREISIKYPNIKIILAHAGRSYCYNDIKNSIKSLKDIENLYVDTAMINNFSVNELLIDVLGSEKVIYGSDLCVAALKGKNVDINNKHYFVTSKPRTWSISAYDMNLEDSFTYFIYEIIRSIKVATQCLNLEKKEIKKIFFGNITSLIENIVKKI